MTSETYLGALIWLGGVALRRGCRRRGSNKPPLPCLAGLEDFHDELAPALLALKVSDLCLKDGDPGDLGLHGQNSTDEFCRSPRHSARALFQPFVLLRHRQPDEVQHLHVRVHAVPVLAAASVAAPVSPWSRRHRSGRRRMATLASTEGCCNQEPQMAPRPLRPGWASGSAHEPVVDGLDVVDRPSGRAQASVVVESPGVARKRAWERRSIRPLPAASASGPAEVAAPRRPHRLRWRHNRQRGGRRRGLLEGDPAMPRRRATARRDQSRRRKPG